MTTWMRTLLFTLAVAIAAPDAVAFTPADLAHLVTTQKGKKKKRRRRRKRKSKSKTKTKASTKASENPDATEAEKLAEIERLQAAQRAEVLRVEAAKEKSRREGRTKSQLTEGAASRWSNRGAEVPIVSPVPVTAPLPARAVPIGPGVSTPGQDLLGGVDEDLLSARLSLSGYSIATAEQDIWRNEPGNNVEQIVPGENRNIAFYRARATMGYDRIAGSKLGLRLDLEYRPRIVGTRLTDKRLNELYVSYGITDFRRRKGNGSWGVAVGRVSVREAGYAQADGVAARFAITDWLRVGAFGGFTGNPYGYNWAQRNTEIFSTKFYTGGAFASVQTPRLQASVAGVMTYANILVRNNTGLDRLYLFVDAAYLVTPELNILLNGWIDTLPGGQANDAFNPSSQLIQNLELVASYRPSSQVALSFGLGRFSTVVYQVSTGYSYVVDPLGNQYNIQLGPILDDNGNPVTTFDSANYTTVYTQVRLRGGYRITRELELFGRVASLIRDASATRESTQAVGGSSLVFSSLRAVPSIGGIYRNPKLVNGRAEVAMIVDSQSQADAFFRLAVSRGLLGFNLGADMRYYLGDINAFDGGLNLSYTIPRGWVPGSLSVRGQFRYFREGVNLLQPTDNGQADDRILLEGQKSVMLFGGVDWRL